MVFFDLIDGVGGVVTAAVGYDDDFYLLVTLMEYAVNGSFEVGASVVGGNDHTD